MKYILYLCIKIDTYENHKKNFNIVGCSDTDQTNGKVKPLKIVIMDVMGKEIMVLDNPTDVINISQVPTGIYFIDIEFANRSERYRIIKK